MNDIGPAHPASRWGMQARVDQRQRFARRLAFLAGLAFFAAFFLAAMCFPFAMTNPPRDEPGEIKL